MVSSAAPVRSLTRALPRSVSWEAATWGAVGLGAALRFVRFLSGPSLWLDEAQLALNLSERSWGGMLDRLDWNQAGPPLFLLAEKLAFTISHSETALRALPFVLSMASLVVFRALACRLVERPAAFAAVVVFAVSPPLVQFAVEAKQYAGDVFVCVLLVWLAVARAWGERGGLLLLGVVGAVAPWLSHPSTFVLATVGCVLFAHALAHGWQRRAVQLALAAAAWLTSFLVYAVTLLPSTESLRQSLRRIDYAPVEANRAALGWYARRATDGMLTFFLGPPFPLGTAAVSAAAVALFVLGFVVLARRRRWAAALTILPVVAVLAASALERYPLGWRFTLFALPGLAIVLAEGIRVAVGSFPPLRTRRVVGAAVVAILVAQAVAVTAEQAVRPPERQTVDVALGFVRDGWRPGDRLVLHYEVQYAARYYSETRGLGAGLWPVRPAPGDARQFSPAVASAAPRLLVTTPDAGSFSRALDSLRGSPRVWVVLSLNPWRTEEAAQSLSELERRGRRVTEVRVPGVVVLLYDLRARSTVGRAA